MFTRNSWFRCPASELHDAGPPALKSFWGSVLFLVYYAIFVLGLESIAPGYIERVWNLDALSGLFLIGIPLEELLFAASFGYYWTGIYEHLTWKNQVRFN
ncbi:MULTISPECIES: lycopene cyclase domain-containing protein [unclassified Methylophaga]|uniref:lycopene cyclase domain-containing protein n=1 Tax=unclassified Methylophaga TaxID=2629249 RepID=UPI002110CF7F|nr:MULTISPECIES: lycopene cyclase domain-containing protein [unclassified Methylophaga]